MSSQKPKKDDRILTATEAVQFLKDIEKQETVEIREWAAQLFIAVTKLTEQNELLLKKVAELERRIRQHEGD